MYDDTYFFVEFVFPHFNGTPFVLFICFNLHHFLNFHFLESILYLQLRVSVGSTVCMSSPTFTLMNDSYCEN